MDVNDQMLDCFPYPVEDFGRFSDSATAQPVKI